MLTFARHFDTNEDNHINRVELQTILDTLGSTLTEDSINRLVGASSRRDLHDCILSLISSPYFQFGIRENFENGMPFDDFVNSAEKWLNSPEGHASGTDHAGDAEHFIRLDRCPMCQAAIPDEIGDMDLMSHVAVST